MSETDYRPLIDGLFAFPHVRYAVVLDDFGNRIVGGMKDGVESSTLAYAE